jgi:hypothetical protein
MSSFDLWSFDCGASTSLVEVMGLCSNPSWLADLGKMWLQSLSWVERRVRTACRKVGHVSDGTTLEPRGPKRVSEHRTDQHVSPSRLWHFSRGGDCPPFEDLG